MVQYTMGQVHHGSTLSRTEFGPDRGGDGLDTASKRENLANIAVYPQLKRYTLAHTGRKTAHIACRRFFAPYGRVYTA